MTDYFKKDYPELAADLREVQACIKAAILIKNKPIKSAIFDILNAGGKMLRPAYLLLFADFTKLDKKSVKALAAAVELLHTATLVHDDVVDKATTRRGVQTISSKYGNDVAVYAGDYLFVSAFRVLSQQAALLSNLADQTGSVERLLVGEVGQMSQRYDLKQSLDDYLANISGKTAELFSMACSAGPLVAGDLRLAKLAQSIGLAIGVAFQVMDDYLDYEADSLTLGKPVLEDVKQGVYTAPVLYAYQIDQAQVAELLDRQAYEALYDFIHSCGALEMTKKLARTYTDKAIRLIGKLPKGETQQKIEQISRQLLERTN